MKPKYDINEYLVCSVGNIISQKFVRKRNDKHFGNAKISYPVLINYQAVKDFLYHT